MVERSFVQEIKWRYSKEEDCADGIKDSTPTVHLLKEEPLAGYIGFDPTAPSLHVGNLTTLMLLRRLQRWGHTPYVVIGGATARVGDPAGKEAERVLMHTDKIEEHAVRVQRQIEHLLAPRETQREVIILNNYDWHRSIDSLSFLRTVGKHFSLNYFLAKESVKNRLQTGISYAEFSYQLLQAYDFYHLYKTHKVRLQMGGSDQWGNITSGIDLIRKKTGESADGFTVPLLTKGDGSKFGKTEEGNVWLDASLTSPYKFYQFWINVNDAEAYRLLRMLGSQTQEEGKKLQRRHIQKPHDRLLQKEIAKVLTTLVHGAKSHEEVRCASDLLFSTKKSIYETACAAFDLLFEEIPHSVCASKIPEENVVDFVFHATKESLFSSKSEVRRAIKGLGLSINQRKIVSEQDSIPPPVHHRYLMIGKGRKSHHLVQLVC